MADTKKPEQHMKEISRKIAVASYVNKSRSVSRHEMEDKICKIESSNLSNTMVKEVTTYSYTSGILGNIRVANGSGLGGVSIVR